MQHSGAGAQLGMDMCAAVCAGMYGGDAHLCTGIFDAFQVGTGRTDLGIVWQEHKRLVSEFGRSGQFDSQLRDRMHDSDVAVR